MKQMDRRLLILMRLRAERPLRAQDLAEECECSVRTVYRDIDALCQAGVPVAAMPGEGYRLVQGYHLPPIAFSVEEAVQLLLGAELALGLGTEDQRQAARSASAKVEAALRPETRREVDRLRERIRVSPWLFREASPWLAVLQQAVIQDRVLRLRYHSFSSDELTEREVEPYFLLFYGSDWHLIGHCRLREGVRDFRCGRIREAGLLAERFERPEHVGEQHDGHGHRHGDGDEVRIWIEASSVPWAREGRGYGFLREEPTEGGSVFVFRGGELRRLLPWILSWGMSARVLAPASVADSVRREVEALAQSYAEG
jgi:predicted DNA-binding transcriptional regulator YafY